MKNNPYRTMRSALEAIAEKTTDKWAAKVAHDAIPISLKGCPVCGKPSRKNIPTPRTYGGNGGYAYGRTSKFCSEECKLAASPVRQNANRRSDLVRQLILSGATQKEIVKKLSEEVSKGRAWQLFHHVKWELEHHAKKYA